MIATDKDQTATAKDSNRRLLFGFRTGSAASRSAGMLTESAKDAYGAKVNLIDRAFREIARLCFECDYTLTPDDWRALDEARLDDPALSYAEVRAWVVEIYRRIQRACLEKGVAYVKRQAQGVR